MPQVCSRCGLNAVGAGCPLCELSTAVPAFVTGVPLTLTSPARISARARSRVAARPRETRRRSRRDLGIKTASHNFKAKSSKSDTATRPPRTLLFWVLAFEF